ncbi:MAG: hypothetical protein U1G07_00455 [Verrucomicrobiota bacterium]
MSDVLLPGVLNMPFVEGLYTEFLRDPGSVPPEWRTYFQQLENGDGASFRSSSRVSAEALPRRTDGLRRQTQNEIRSFGAQDRVDQLIRVYRMRGHTIAQVDPLGRTRPSPPELDPSFYGLSEADMDRKFSCETLYAECPLPLREILRRLRSTYCRFIGVEYMHIDDLTVRRWLRKRMEPTENRIQLSRDEQIRILTRLTDAVTFEEFIRKSLLARRAFPGGLRALFRCSTWPSKRRRNRAFEKSSWGWHTAGVSMSSPISLGKAPSDLPRI